jgi:hypothetical protein
MPKNLEPFKINSAGRPRYWAPRQRRATAGLVVSTVCTMTSSGQARTRYQSNLNQPFNLPSREIGTVCGRMPYDPADLTNHEAASACGHGCPNTHCGQRAGRPKPSAESHPTARAFHGREKGGLFASFRTADAFWRPELLPPADTKTSQWCLYGAAICATVDQ